ncbi:general regulatory factor 9 [Striga asiatica]|uniref:General regulatory factor 9 n=1 Tax=Striga asiatica TaxID=4170 RepID=A0A5A7P7E4_STRAF|nr:general regulatory factor 9 [Striga asiatica]
MSLISPSQLKIPLGNHLTPSYHSGTVAEVSILSFVRSLRRQPKGRQCRCRAWRLSTINSRRPSTLFSAAPTPPLSSTASLSPDPPLCSWLEINIFAIFHYKIMNLMKSNAKKWLDEAEDKGLIFSRNPVTIGIAGSLFKSPHNLFA